MCGALLRGQKREMTHVRRRLFNLAVVASFVLCVTTVALWVRGRVSWNYDQISFNGRTRDDGAQTSLRASNTPFGIDVGRVRANTFALAERGWHFRSSRSTLTGSDSVGEAYAYTGGAGIAGIW
jgi:hypothetical protein